MASTLANGRTRQTPRSVDAVSTRSWATPAESVRGPALCSRSVGDSPSPASAQQAGRAKAFCVFGRAHNVTFLGVNKGVRRAAWVLWGTLLERDASHTPQGDVSAWQSYRFSKICEGGLTQAAYGLRSFHVRQPRHQSSVSTMVGIDVAQFRLVAKPKRRLPD